MFSLFLVLTSSPLTKEEVKVEYRLLNVVMAKSVIAKVGSFDAVITERLEMMVSNSTGVQLTVLVCSL
ncbi:protein argonaute 4-like [Dorcoceras hygrometricum]|uniref:Protein argonaute 4-like n=1 Tax=Dorcoceras hygrometricum TaxID=472368 RepID=A0A2Z7ANY9_9LAMI|nr:protein argonaute 4-like [Dorcoceras hygrometricum]